MELAASSVDTISRILTASLVPHLQLSDLQQLRHSCLDLRSLVDAAPHILWIKAARWEAASRDHRLLERLTCHPTDCSCWRRNTLPEDHPLCTATESVRLQAEQYARLHTRLRADSPPKVTSVVLHEDTHAQGLIGVCRLAVSPSHSGAPLKCTSKHGQE